ncbi:MAG: EcoRV family type II restriction endonuclease [Anaerolineaceae bacterium]|nr:EcoRV family type II restriction endonuclease [Anaerolineaceae bacterium]
MPTKAEFEASLKGFASTLSNHVSTDDGQWTIKGFIDTFKNVYTISSDTKIVSKILEIHLFPKILAFADQHGFAIVLAEHQNYYPDISFVSKSDASVKFAVDLKTTYRLPDKPWLCSGFTLGSHGKYFEDRTSTKNIQFPYGSYLGHFCLGIIYDRADDTTIDETCSYQIEELHSITSVISNIQFFVAEKWKIASDKSGSGNTANIGSIQRIEDILSGNGMFARLGEEWFDDYWMNFGKITIKDEDEKTRKITSLANFVKYRGGDSSLIVARNNQQ